MKDSIGEKISEIIGCLFIMFVVFSIFGTLFHGCIPKDDHSSEYYQESLQEQNEYIADQAEEDKGRRDSDALSCEMAKDFIGEKAIVKGSVENINYATETSGSPTFIDLGYEYPDKRRVTIVIWEENYSKVAEIVDDLFYGDIIYVTGTLEEYGGAVQIEVSDADQIELE